MDEWHLLNTETFEKTVKQEHRMAHNLESTTACKKGDIKTTVSNSSVLEKSWEKKNKMKDA